MSKERCSVRDELTGHAGSGEDSVFIDTPNGEIGPLCPECLDAIRAFVDDDTGASKALAAAKAEIERLQQQSEAQHKSYGEVVGRLNAAEAELLRQLQALTEELAYSMNTARDTQGLLTCERADHEVAEASADKHWRNLVLLQARIEELERAAKSALGLLDSVEDWPEGESLTTAKADLATERQKSERLTYALKVCRAVLILQQLSDSANGKPEAAESCQPFIDLIDETLGGAK